MISTPLAADFGPDPEAAAEGPKSPGGGGGGPEVARRRRRRCAQLPRAADFGPGPEAAAEVRADGRRYFSLPGPEAAAQGRAAGRGACSLRLSPPFPAWPGVVGEGVRGWMGRSLSTPLAQCQLRVWLEGDGGWAASWACSWTGSLISTPLAADFGPGPEEAADGRVAGRGTCSLRLYPPTSGLARWRRRRARSRTEAAAEGRAAASHCRLRA